MDMKKLIEKFKKPDFWNRKLMKLSVIAFTLFVLKIWPVTMEWVHGVHWGWFLGATVILGLIPFLRRKKK